MRKPAIVEMVGGRSARQRVWEAIRALGAGDAEFTAAEISRRAKVELGIVTDYLRGLTAAQIVDRVSYRRGVASRYRLLRDTGIEAPRVRRDGTEVTQGRGVEAMWGAITVLDAFNAKTIADIAGVALETAKTYCLMLGRAGYLEPVQPGHGIGKGGVLTMWRTVRSLVHGPRAPMITRLKAVYDPNVHRIVWSEGADEAVEASDA